MVVDDNSHGLKYFVQALRKAYHTVDLRSDVEQAYHAFKGGLASGRWDGAILDLMFTMPQPPARYMEKDPSGLKAGYHLLCELRELQPDVPVIVLTNSRDRELMERLRSMPRVLVLRKLDQDVVEFVPSAEDFFSLK